jgi:hypothetical protein
MNYCPACQRHLNGAVSCPGCGRRTDLPENQPTNRRAETRAAAARKRTPDAETTMPLPSVGQFPEAGRSGAPDDPEAGRQGRRMPRGALACVLVVPVILAGGAIFIVTSGGQPSGTPAASPQTSALPDPGTSSTAGDTPPDASGSPWQSLGAPQDTADATSSASASATATASGTPSPTGSATASAPPPPSPSPTQTHGGKPPAPSPSPTCTHFLLWCS